MVSLRMALAVAASLLAPAAAWAAPDCTDLMPSGARFPARNLVPEDLVRLRDIGPVDPNQQDEGLFSVSPDGRHAAFQLRRGDPASNGFCLAMLVVDLRTRAVRVVDRGGDFMRLRFDARGVASFPSGFTDPVTPRWSPDGKSIVYRRRDRGAVQLWRAEANGSGSEAITDSIDDVDAFRLTIDGLGIVYATKPGLRDASAAIDKEGLSGFRYDDRFVPAAASRPFPLAPIARAAWYLDLASRTVRPATPEETALLDKGAMQEGSWSEATSVDGDRASLQVPARTLYAARGRLIVTRHGQTLTCGAPECADANQPWWVGGKVRFVRHEGWANSVTAIYEWTPGTPGVRRLYATEDLFLGCVPTGATLTCLREGSLQPRRLERLDPASGERTPLFDPNPEFASLKLGQVERLRSRNSFGMESFADLVLPVGYVPGQRYPLVVVQYNSRGFLRGGTGDDYPIQAFANRGFAVLSFDRPRSVGFKSTTDPVEAERINLKDFADRRSVLEAIESPVRLAIERGIADPARIGMTGLSDGASTVQYALLHSKLFSAFAMSSCCWDSSLPLRVGPMAARQFHEMGYPRTVDDDAAAQAFWRGFSVSRNARDIHAPILAQVSDDEFWVALQSVTALRELDRPIDLYVFPDEHHVKWQPAHRLAVYSRALDWFDYWLNGVKAPGRAGEVAYWEALRHGLSGSAGASATAPPP
ncbi:Atxe2 family lasso peptide isopeptidase [Sphingomonas sp. HITSZ_GF]|uniref:Atxe2 family lasso peptide isopeptidase n=1 Tax=Sphingomonas sp. HITSZ_GF TaxID=3037247 RepID=UPI00240E4B72|nr:Atxe2 family lasso peptide isopeptidase [Sphingomonas sp. HITSZ_GF]MDG2535240.1 Atxe2 family lasso peptide isopeptidase [Sphingomonas sp. HITSZ_GF]